MISVQIETFTIIELTFEQPVKVLIPVTEYNVETVGLITILDEVAEVFHKYLFAPFAVRLICWPEQIVLVALLIETEGDAFTIIVIEFVFEQPVTLFVPLTL